MSSGRLGNSNLSATTNTTVYTVPASKTAVVTISLCNRNSGGVAVRLAIGASSTPALDEYIEYDTIIPGNTALERTGLVMDASRQLIAYAGTTGISAVCWGYEESV